MTRPFDDRLSVSEQFRTCDLTDVELEPAREFPGDGAVQEGFTNTGQSLAMSPALVQKYLDAGKDGLQNHLLTTHRDDFVRQFFRKLLGYSLGRGVQLSEDPLLDQMQHRLAKKSFRFSVSVDTIVVSDQFCTIRARPSGL